MALCRRRWQQEGGLVFADITDRKDKELKQQAQLERLAFVQQITARSAIARTSQYFPGRDPHAGRPVAHRLRLDLSVRTGKQTVVVTSVGRRSQELAMALALTEQARPSFGENGLSSACAASWSMSRMSARWIFRFHSGLHGAGAGIRCGTLLVESRVFGGSLLPGRLTTASAVRMRIPAADE